MKLRQGMLEYRCWVRDARRRRLGTLHVAGLLLPYVCRDMHMTIDCIENGCGLLFCRIVLSSIVNAKRKQYVDL